MTTGSSDPLPPPEGEVPGTEAEALFHRRLLDGGGVDGDELEVLCSSHPVLAAELRSLAAHHRRGRELFGAAGADVTASPEQQDEPPPRYVVRREIARGGMGRILEVWDRELRRALAMKVPHAAVDTDPAGNLHKKLSHSRLINEAQILAQLDHPGVVPVHEVGRDAEGRPYFTMQLVRGRTLREVLDEKPGGSAGWTPTRVVTVMMRVCQAVAYAHSRGVIHRDLKPSNVMTGSFGEVYVMDWGLARARHHADEDDVRTRIPSMEQAGSAQAGASRQTSVRTDRREQSAKDPSSPLQTMQGDVLGTPSYMSPEQAEGRTEDVDERSDVYGAGAMLYHLLTRRAPYTRDGTDSTPLEILERVLKESPEDMERVAPHVPRELAAVCRKAMARDPARRYAGMSELADDLGAYLEGRVVRAYRTGPLIELWKWTRRHRAAALAAGVIVLALVLGGVQELRSSRQQRRLNVELTASLYVNQVQLAAGALSRGDTTGLRKHLERAPAALRGWEWDLLSRQADTSERTVAVPGGCYVMAWSRDGSTIAAANDTRVLLWRAATLDRERALLHPFGEAGPMAIDSLDVSHDGGFLAAAARNGRVRLWDLEAEEDEGSLLPERGLLALAFSPVSPQLATTGADGRLALWNVRTREVEQQSHGHEGPARAVAWSNDGSLLVSVGDDGVARGWDPLTLAELWQVDVSVDTPLDRLAVAPSGVRIAVGSSTAKWVRVLEVPSGELDWSFALDKDLVRRLAWSPDGRTLAVASGGSSPILLDAASGEFQSRLVGHGQQAYCVQFSPDARRIATGSHDGTLKLWDHERCLKEGWLRPGRGEIRGMAFRSDGREVAFVHLDGALEIWDTRTRTQRAVVSDDPELTSIAWSPNDRIIATGGSQGELVFHDAASLDVVARIEDRSSRGPIAFLPDGEHLAKGPRDGRLELWSWRDGELVWKERIHTGHCSGLAVSPDGRLIASAGQGGLVRLVEAATGAVLQTLQGELVFAGAVGFSRDGSRLVTRGRSANKDETGTQVWDVASGTLIWSRLGLALGPPAFSPDGSRILAPEWPASLAVLDAETGEEIALVPLAWGESRGRVIDASAFALAPDGRMVVVGLLEAEARPDCPMVFVEARPWADFDR